MKQKEDFDKYLTTGEVASLFRVDPKTVTRWAKSGRLDAVRTLGGHRRFSRAQVETALKLNTDED
jgi:excisionase family DNA binding protein